MARLALTVVRKTPLLSQCTPQSFAGALLTAAALGLEPGVNDEAYLVPYRDKKKGIVEAQLIIGYQGMAKLFYQHPLAQNLDAQVVYENDEFDYEMGTAQYLRHKPALSDRGKIVAYYAVAKLTTGATAFTVLSPQEVKTLRRGKVGTSGDIPDPQHWMERKTVLRQLIKLLPKSANLITAAASDERAGSELYRDRMLEKGGPAAIEPAPADSGEDEPIDVSALGEAVELISPEQLARLDKLLEEAGLTKEADALAWMSDVIGITDSPLKAKAHLTSAEADRIFAELDKAIGGEA